MGGILAWRVIDVPASGQISNVSKLVLPERAGMADDGSQPMFPEIDKLLELERLRLERERLKLQRKALRRPKSKAAPQAPTQHEPRKAYRPQNKAHRTYDGLRTSYLDYERAVREVVGQDGEVKHEAVYADAGGPSPKTQRREMASYGLDFDRDWPPSKWSKVAPVSRNGTN